MDEIVGQLGQTQARDAGDPVIGAIGTVNGQTAGVAHNAEGFFEHISAGWQQSSLGLAVRGKAPDTFANPDAPWYDRIASNLAGMAGDAPAMAAGYFAGAALPLPGAGKMLAAGAGSFAAPAAVRAALMDYYTTGHVDLGHMAMEAGKSAVIGAVTFGAGGALAKVLPETSGALMGLGRNAAIGTGELGAMTAAQSVMDWHLPSAQEFGDNALLVFGIRGAREYGIPLLKKIYADTGTAPAQVALDAQTDSAVAQALHNNEIPGRYTIENGLRRRVRGDGEAVVPKDPTNPNMGPMPVDEQIMRANENRLREFHTEEGMHESLSILAGEIAEQIEVSRKGGKPDAQLKAEARAAAAQIAEDVGHGKGIEAIGDAGILGLAKVLKASFDNVRQSAADLLTMQREHKAGNVHDDVMTQSLAKYVQQEGQLKALMADYLGAKAEAGRALRALRLVQDNIGDVKNLQKALLGDDKTPAVGGGADAILRRASSVQASETNRAVASIARSSTFFDKTVEWWKASILSGPTTQIRNIVSNMVFGAARIPKTFVTAMISEARGAKGEGATPYRQAIGEAYGTLTGFMSGIRAAGEILSDHYTKGVETPTGGKAEQYKGAIGTDENSGLVARNFGKGVRTPFALLSAMDAVSKSIVEHMVTYGQASKNAKMTELLSGKFYDKALNPPAATPQAAAGMTRWYHGGSPEGVNGPLWFTKDLRDAEGWANRGEGMKVWFTDVPEAASKALTGEDLANGIPGTTRLELAAEYADKRQPYETGPASTSGNSIAKLAAEEALKYTFQTELPSWAKRAMSSLYDVPGLNKVLPFIFPFVRTPANVYLQAVRQLPLLGAAVKAQRDDFAKGGAARDRAMAEHVMGSAMGLTVVGLVGAGLMTGGGPPKSDSQGRRAWLLTHQPYSVKVGDQWFSYNSIEPFATSMGIMADLWDVKHLVSDHEYEMAMHAVGAAFSNQVTNKTFLETFGTFAKLLDPDSGSGNPFGGVAAQVASGIFPNIISQPAKQMDPQLRETRLFVDKLINRVPGWRLGLLPQRDLFGEPMPHERMWDAFGIQVSPTHQNDPVRMELGRIGYAPVPLHQEGQDREMTLPGSQVRGMQILPGAMGREAKVPVTDAQFDAMQTDAGKVARPVLEQLFASPGYQGAPLIAKRQVVEQIFGQSRTMAKYQNINPDQINKSFEELERALQKR